MLIAMGSRVTLHYSLAFLDGTVITSSFGEEPLHIAVGSGELDKTLELALLGLKSGDLQVLTLNSGQAFGERDAAAQRWMSRESFPADMELMTGTIVEFETSDGAMVTGSLTDVEPGRVLVDYNHPLAGHALIYRVHILSVEEPANSGSNAR